MISFILFVCYVCVGFVGFCWESVGFMLGFMPFCWVLNVKIQSWASVNICKCWVQNGQTQQKPTEKAAIPNETQQNPTNPTGGIITKKPHEHTFLTFERFFNVGMLGLFCKKQAQYENHVRKTKEEKE